MAKKNPFAKAAKGALGGKQRIMTAPPAPMLGMPPGAGQTPPPPMAPPIPPRPIGNAGSALGMALAAARAKRANGGM